MFNFLCAVVAIYMFRRNDPFHFANMSRTMVTLYRFETLQSWEMVLYINMFGCDRVGYGVHWQNDDVSQGIPSADGSVSLAPH